MIDEADGRINSTDHSVGATSQGICFNNTSEWKLAREVVVESEEILVAQSLTMHLICF